MPRLSCSKRDYTNPGLLLAPNINSQAKFLSNVHLLGCIKLKFAMQNAFSTLNYLKQIFWQAKIKLRKTSIVSYNARLGDKKTAFEQLHFGL